MINDGMDVNEWLRKQLEETNPDLLRELVQTFAEVLMSADADEMCGAPHGVVSLESGESAERVSDSPLGHSGRIDRFEDSEAA